MLKYILIVSAFLFTKFSVSQSYDLLPVRTDSLHWGYINTKGEVDIKGPFDDAYFFYGERARIKLNGRYGFIDKKGNMVIPARYHLAHDFSCELSLVEDSIYYEHFIDTKGEKVFGLPKGVDIAEPFINGFSKVLSQYFTYETKTPTQHYKIGFMNTNGDIVFATDADDVGDFDRGRAIIIKNKTLGLIDTTGNYILKPKYDYIGTFCEGLALVRKGKYYGYIDTAGKLAIKTKYINAADFANGLAPITLDSLWGYINHKGKIIIPREYMWAESFSGGLAGVVLNKKWGMIDLTGYMKVRPIFNDYAPFSEGLAAVKYKEAWGYIDVDAVFKIEPQYTLAGSFINGVTQVEDGVNNIYIDKTGHKIYSFRKHKKEHWW